MEVTFNKFKLLLFKDSPLCPLRYKELSIDELYNVILNEDKAYYSYGAFSYLMWRIEKSLRFGNAKKSNVMDDPYINAKMKKRQQALDEIKVAKVHKIADTPALLVGKDYRRLFLPDIDKHEWNDIELLVRKMFFEEFNKLEDDGGCSGCEKSKLIRKYIKKLKELLE